MKKNQVIQRTVSCMKQTESMELPAEKKYNKGVIT